MTSLRSKLTKIDSAIGMPNNPITPNNFSPINIPTSVTSGCRPICLPTIRGSIILRTTTMKTYRAKMPKANPPLPRIAAMMAHGIKIPPVPRIGKISNTATNIPIKMEFGTPKSVKPTANSTKVMEKIREYDLIYFTKICFA